MWRRDKRMSIFAHTIYKTTLKFTRHFGVMGNDLILVMQCCWLLIKIILIITGYTSRILWTDLYITTYSNRIWSSRFITLVSSAMLLVMRLQSRFMSEKHYFRRFRSILIGFIRTLSFTRVSRQNVGTLKLFVEEDLEVLTPPDTTAHLPTWQGPHIL